MSDPSNPLRLEAVGVLRHSRRRYGAASKRRLVEACLQPGVSLANLLRKWVAGQQREQRNGVAVGAIDRAPEAFVPVVELHGVALYDLATAGDVPRLARKIAQFLADYIAQGRVAVLTATARVAMADQIALRQVFHRDHRRRHYGEALSPQIRSAKLFFIARKRRIPNHRKHTTTATPTNRGRVHKVHLPECTSEFVDHDGYHLGVAAYQGNVTVQLHPQRGDIPEVA
jgi:hypothetical protein